MDSILPIEEMEAAWSLQAGEIPDVGFPAATPQVFSAEMASALMNLCARAELEGRNVLVRERGEDVYVALRSGRQAAELLNVKSTTRVVEMGMAYGPFVQAYQEEVAGKLAPMAGKRLWLAGHGIGGAYALLAAMELKASAVYTFGAPRVGNARFVRALPCPVFRVVNNLDVMVTMPTAWKWRHAGEYKLINADGSLNANPNVLSRLPSFSRQTVWLGELLKQGLESGFPRALFSLLRQVLGDHAVRAYVERLNRLKNY